ncbi:MAG: BamA/TamA family outer membrane protein [Bacteroidales bacterium]|nr:BamA/TamA family outer membrane protein [Bacteroidales bacterium]
MRRLLSKISLLVMVVVLASCGAGRAVPEGKYILKENKVAVLGSKEVAPSELTPYIKQSATHSVVLGIKSLFVAPVILDDTAIPQSVTRMKNHLEYLGYYNSDVDPEVLIKRKKAVVKYNVTLGRQYPIKEITYTVRDTALYDELMRDSTNFKVRPGDNISQKALESESERIAANLRNNGYYGFTKNYLFFYGDSVSVRDSVLLHIRLEDYTRNENPSLAKPHRKYHIGKVEIVPQGKAKVRESFLNRMNRIESGSLYSDAAINNTYNRFASNRMFSTVNVLLNEVDTSTVDCRIQLSQSKLQSMRLNFEGSFNAAGLLGITPSLSYSHKNFFGGGEIFNLGFRGNFQFMYHDPVHSSEAAISSSISFPNFLLIPDGKFFDNSIPRTDISLSYNIQRRPEYFRNIISASYGYSWNVNENLRLQIDPAQVNIVRIFNMDEEFYNSLNSSYLQYSYQNHVDIGNNIAAYYTTNPATNPKETYFYVRWQCNTAGNMLNAFNPFTNTNERGEHLIWKVPYAQYVRNEVTAVETFRFGGDDKLALAARLMAGVGYAYGNSTAIPLEKMFYAGGANSMRGWQSRTLGPGNSPLDSTFAIYNQTGDMRLEANLELRFPLFWKLEGALFADVGNIWNLPKKRMPVTDTQALGVFSFRNLAKSTAVSWGTGIRLDLGMILVRVDIGFKGYDPETMKWLKPEQWFESDGYALHFGIGYPF